ncbi:MAG: C1 family peptidase [Bacteroidales bacterium]|nr:C1 family peptidase [Bacteroidales bacterium]
MKRVEFLVPVLVLLFAGMPLFAQQHLSGCVYLPEKDGKTQYRPRLETRDYATMPRQYSLKKYCPAIKDQGEYNTCTAWATTYAARTICEAAAYGWTNTDSITTEAFSPAFVYSQLVYSQNCGEASSIGESLGLLKEVGTVKYSSCNAPCAGIVSPELQKEAYNYKIDDYALIFSDYGDNNVNKVLLTKKALSHNHPVVVSMTYYKSFDTIYEVWNGKQDTKVGNHAVCVVGYDDDKFGGAFEIMNSWGPQWGNGGFAWIRYNDYSNIVRYAYDLYIQKLDLSWRPVDGEEYNLSGNVEFLARDGGSCMNFILDSIGEMVHYYTDEDYMSGKKFRLSVGCNDPAWVYVIATDLQNNITKLFPYSDKVSAFMSYNDTHIAIPDETHEFKLDNTIGTDYFCVLYSRVELDIDALIDKIKVADGSIYKKLKTVLGNLLVNQGDVEYNRDKVAFSSGTSAVVVPIMVEISHRGISEE